MKVIEGTEDRFGKYPIIFKSAKGLREVFDYLYSHYQGYKFCILMDAMKDEWEDYGKDITVYFLDEVLEEAAYYSDCEIWKYGKKIFPKNGG